MGYFQDLADRPESKAKRVAQYAQRRAELATKTFNSADELVTAYAAAHNMTETETRPHLRKRWDTAAANNHKWVILSNLKSGYSAPWGTATIN